MKILAVCGHGLGSSFMLEMNIKKILKELDIEAEVGHSDLSSVTDGDADYFVMGRDIAAGLNLKNIVVLDNIIMLDELRKKLTEALKS